MGTTIEDRLILGDVSVLEDMYDRSGALLYAIAGVLDPDNKERITAAVFSDAWRNRRDFDPSRGTVRAWLVRQTRLSYPMGPESNRRIDELVVAATVSDMDEVQRQILIEGSAASGRTEDLAEHLDLPIGTVESHLRRGIRTLQSELVDSRLDEDDSRLAAIVRSGRLESDLAKPSSDVWSQIVEAAGIDETTTMETSLLTDDPEILEPEPDQAGLPAEEAAEVTGSSDDSEEHDADSRTLGLVDEFSTTEFPGRTPLQPAVSGTDSDNDAETLESDGFLAVDRPDEDATGPAWATLGQESSEDLEHLDDPENNAGGDETVDDDGVPYVLSGRYRPGVDDDPYAEASASEKPEPAELDDDRGLEDTDKQTAERLAAAEPTYFDTGEDVSEIGLNAPARPWVRVAMVAVAAVILLAIVLTLG